MKRAVQQRRSLRTLVTKELNEVHESMQEVTDENKDAVRKMVAIMKSHQAELNEHDKCILENIEEEKFDFETSKIYEYKDALTESIAELEGKLDDLFRSKTVHVQSPGFASFSSDGDMKRERIPEMELTSFDGNPLNWEEFWDDFTISVDSRKDMTTITKFKLLRKCLTGSAAAACKGYQLTESNYGQVKSILEERFGDKETAVALHLEALVKLKPATHSVSDLVRVRDECEAHIRALVILGFQEDTFGQLFAPIILSKLPKFVRLEIRKQRKMSGQSEWTMQKLREVLSTEIELRTSNEHEFFVPDERPQQKRGDRDNRYGSSDRNNLGTGQALYVHGTGRRQEKEQKPQDVKCIYCDGDHYNDKCEKFGDVASRHTRLDELRRCYRCLGVGHQAAVCRRPGRECFHCKKHNHHRSLCLAKYGKSTGAQDQTTLVSDKTSELNPEAPEFAPDNVYAVNTVASGSRSRARRGTAILESALVLVKGETGSCLARLVGDNGSTKSYISAKLAKKIGAKRTGFEITSVGRFGECKRQTKQLAIHEFSITLRNGEQKVVEMDVEEHLAPLLTLYPVDLDQIEPYCKVDEMAEVIVDKPTEVEIDILMGLDYYYSFVCGKEIRCSNGLILKESSLGYILTGYKQSEEVNLSGSYQMLVIGDRNRDPFDLEKFWRLEDVGIKDDPGQDDDEAALKHFQDTAKVVDGRYQVQWPFKSENPDLPDNYNIALQRLKGVHRKLKADVSLMQTYDKILKTQETLGVIELAPEEPDGPIHHLCHHCVLKPESATTPVRVVFDASAKPHAQALSLNEAMYRGPVFLNDLCGMLLRFRMSPTVVLSDIEKAFLQISLQEHHRDYTRFLWLKDTEKPVSSDNIQVFRYARVLFGATASPFLLAASINHHMKQVGGQTAESIVQNTYVDNIISGHETAEAALKYYREARSLFAMISMNLREWYSNDKRFMSGVAEADRGKSEKPSVLGIKWSIANDRISCTTGKLQTCGHITKRIILKSIASVYDPCGWFGPVTVRGKLMMQDLWATKKGWDEPLDPAAVSAWLELAKDLQKLSLYSLPRYVGADLLSGESDIQLHCFSDASAKAFGAAVYLRVKSRGETKCNLVFAKSRVAPLRKQLSIPRLELVAATIGSHVIDFVSEELALTATRKILWVDSMCVVNWLESTTISTVFVGNRVKQIKSIAGLEFRHVPTEDNPADVISRGTELSTLMDNEQWWHGPAWMMESEDHWPQRSAELDQNEKETTEVADISDTEVDQDTCTLVSAEGCEKLFELNQYSTTLKLLGVTSKVMRALNILAPKFVSKCFPEFRKIQPQMRHIATAKELSAARMFWDKRIQQQHFPEEARKQSSKEWRTLDDQLGLFVDDKGLIRCRGRFSQAAQLSESAKFPKLLPRTSRYTHLLVEEFHKAVLHAGVKQTLAKIRSEYWIPQGRSVVKRVLHDCRRCRRHIIGPFKIPNPPPLPEFRASVHRPFACVGLDYLGPLLVKSDNGNERVKEKVWIALFTCSVIRAIYLDVVRSLSTAEFLLCLRRFIATHGQPNLIVSDNAKQFKMADSVQKKLWLDVMQSDEIQEYSASAGIEWKFIPELSPWMGGFYERMVRPVKDALRKSLGSRSVSLQELQTLVLEVASVVNDRPLLYSESDPSEQTLTPAHLMFRSSALFPEVEDVDEFRLKRTMADDLIAHWKKGQKMLRQFWDGWRNQYLLSLREQHVKHKQRATSEVEAEVGMIVLLKDNLPRGMWRMGRVTKLIHSKDGQVRSVAVKLANGNLVNRPLKLLCPLEKASTDVKVLPEGDSNSTSAPDAEESAASVRPKRQAAIRSAERTKLMLQDE